MKSFLKMSASYIIKLYWGFKWLFPAPKFDRSKYYQENKQRFLSYNRIAREKNREAIAVYKRNYYKNHKAEIQAYNKEYYKSHKDKPYYTHRKD